MNRNLLVKRLPCIACELFGVYRQPFPTEAHHLNLDGKAGQKRRGDEFSIPLCQWHHVGKLTPGVALVAMTALYGPSLARQSKRFREVFGNDDHLLSITDENLRSVA